MVLGKVPVPGRPTILMTVGQGLTALAVGAVGVCLDSLTPESLSLSPSLWETARYRLKYCVSAVKPVSTNQPTILGGRVMRWSWVCFQCRGVLEFG